MEPKVSIIIVNYNGYHDTVECIKSLLMIDYNNFEIIVVDNASEKKPTQEELDIIEKNSIFLKSKTNLGFSGGNNIGIKEAMKHHTKYVLLINNDTTVEPDFLKNVVDIAEQDCSIGIVGCKIKYYSDKNLIWYAGGEYNRKIGKAIQYKFNCQDKTAKNKNEVLDSSFVTGCLMLLPSSVINQVGLLDESFFLYSEDVEYCCRVIDHGYRLVCSESAVIYHKINASTGSRSYILQYYTTRNSFMMIKMYSNSKLFGYLYQLCVLIKRLIKGDRDFKPCYDGVRDFIKGKKGKA